MNNKEIIKIKPSEICNIGRVPVKFIRTHPFIETVQQIVNDWDIKYKDTSIYDYYKYERFNPKSLSDFYNIDNTLLSSVSSNNIF